MNRFYAALLAPILEVDEDTEIRFNPFLTERSQSLCRSVALRKYLLSTFGVYNSQMLHRDLIEVAKQRSRFKSRFFSLRRSVSEKNAQIISRLNANIATSLKSFEVSMSTAIY